jgi:hypothetical protein
VIESLMEEEVCDFGFEWWKGFYSSDRKNKILVKNTSG